MKIYFDNAATTPPYTEVVTAITKSLRTNFGNPSSTHQQGRSARAEIELSRKKIAQQIGVFAQEIIFNSGATEGINTVLCNAIYRLGIKRIITSYIEHHSVINFLETHYDADVQIDFLNLSEDGQPNLNHLEEQLAESKKKTLVCLMYVNNEIGNILDVVKTGAICSKYNALFLCDGAQAVGKMPLQLKLSNIAFLTASAHKFHGPKGVGFLYIKKNRNILPFIHGGGQERGLRAGTESVHNIVGMKTALEISYRDIDKKLKNIEKLKSQFLGGLKTIFPVIHQNGSQNKYPFSLPHICNVTIPMDFKTAQLLSFKLDMKGISCSTGSACQDTGSSSHVLDTILPSNLKGFPSIRFSFSEFNTPDEVNYVLQAFKQIKDEA